MRFEWDPAKNEANMRGHKVSFEEAAEIWNDPDLMILHAKRKGEKRLMAIGRTCAMLLSVVHTERGEGTVRIISARRTTEKERKNYERNAQQ
mgnify:FL=1